LPLTLRKRSKGLDAAMLVSWWRSVWGKGRGYQWTGARALGSSALSTKHRTSQKAGVALVTHVTCSCLRKLGGLPLRSFSIPRYLPPPLDFVAQFHSSLACVQHQSEPSQDSTEPLTLAAFSTIPKTYSYGVSLAYCLFALRLATQQVEIYAMIGV
jgi:hypothetical protein